MAYPLPKVEGVSHRFVEVDGRRFHCALAGGGSPIVLLHGFPQHWYCWRYVIDGLAERHRVVALDLRGFGWSDIAWEGFDKETMASDVAGVIEGLDLDRVSIVGHDWGAWVGYLLALQRPELVERLVALSMPPPFIRPGPRIVTGIVRGHQFVMASPLAGAVLHKRRYMDRLLGRWSLQSENLPDSVRTLYQRDIRASTRVRAAMLLHRTWLTRELIPVLAGRYRAQVLETPTLVIHGEDDPVTPPRLFRSHRGFARSLEVETVPGAGHMLPEEHPGLVIKRVLEFVDGLAQVEAKRVPSRQQLR
jgi:pimeloyl-ACP methyl ester carboxylesterase